MALIKLKARPRHWLISYLSAVVLLALLPPASSQTEPGFRIRRLGEELEDADLERSIAGEESLNALIAGRDGGLETKERVKEQDKLFLDGKELPEGFVFGCATSAYQVEGAWNVSGKSHSIWDTFAHDTGKGHIANDENGDVADDFYHHYETDLPLYRDAIGVDYYDFTIAWTRILPNGNDTEVNQAGIDFYKRVIQRSKDVGLKNFCTLYHWDIPQVLQDRYKSWLSPQVVKDFRHYAEKVFENLADICFDWVTMNEPRTFCTEGFGPEPDSAPGLKGPVDDQYTCMHHALLAHSEAVDVYRQGVKDGKWKGKIGIKIDGSPGIPLDANNKSHVKAVQRANDFEIGWDVAPLYTGDYPEVMRQTMGSKLPNFTSEESEKLKGSVDFLGLDAYTSQWVTPVEDCENDPDNDAWPECVNSYDEDPNTGVLLGKPTESSWNFQVNSTIYDGLHYLHDRWNATNLIVGENGMAVRNESQFNLAQATYDVERIDWFQSTAHNLRWALDDELPLVGFVPWSCMSNLEWSGGYAIDFGLIRNNFTTQQRHPKLSATYLKSVFKGGKRIEPLAFV